MQRLPWLIPLSSNKDSPVTASNSSSFGSGFLFAVCVFAGVIGGLLLDQPSKGLAAGLIGGVVLAIASAVRDYRRKH
jgi:hypothetical protein